MRVGSVIQRATFLAFPYIVATSKEDRRRLRASLSGRMYCARAALAIRHNIILRRAVLLERYQIYTKSKRCWQGGYAGVGGALGGLVVDGSVGRCGGRQLSWECEDCFPDENGGFS